MGSYDPVRGHLRDRVAPSRTWALAYFVGLFVGGVLAAWTFDPAIETAVSLIRIVATLDVAAFVPAEFLVMVVFFVSYSVATRSLDRLAVGGLRSFLAD